MSTVEISALKVQVGGSSSLIPRLFQPPRSRSTSHNVSTALPSIPTSLERIRPASPSSQHELTLPSPRPPSPLPSCACLSYPTLLRWELGALYRGRGPKKHMSRLAAPKSWMLDKLGGTSLFSRAFLPIVLTVLFSQAPSPPSPRPVLTRPASASPSR